MRVLFLKDVEGVGRAGDVKDVNGGYAKNYLLLRRLAVPATEGALKQAQALKEAAKGKSERKLTEAQSLASKIEGQVVLFRMRAGEGDRLYGSVTNTDVAEALSRSIGMEVDRRHVDLEHSIKALGEHPVTVKLGSGLNATVRVIVEKSEED